MREIKWIMQGITDVLEGVILLLFLQEIFKYTQNFIPNHHLIWKIITTLLEISSWSYVFHVAKKKTWITKELYVSFGIIIAGLIFDPTSAIIGFILRRLAIIPLVLVTLPPFIKYFKVGMPTKISMF